MNTAMKRLLCSTGVACLSLMSSSCVNEYGVRSLQSCPLPEPEWTAPQEAPALRGTMCGNWVTFALEANEELEVCIGKLQAVDGWRAKMQAGQAKDEK